MSDDFYCDEVLNNHTLVQKVYETDNVLAFHHTRPFWPVHIVVIPKKHITSLLDVTSEDMPLVTEMLTVIQKVSQQVVDQHGGAAIHTHLGQYQDSKHLHWHIHYGKPVGNLAL